MNSPQAAPDEPTLPDLPHASDAPPVEQPPRTPLTPTGTDAPRTPLTPAGTDAPRTPLVQSRPDVPRVPLTQSGTDAPRVPLAATGPYVGGAPQPAPLPGKWNVGRLLRRLSGVDEQLLAWVPQERARYTGLGGTVLTTALLAFISMTFALGLAFSTTSPLVIIPALVWFVLILNFDRWLVSTPLTSNVWRRIPTILVRLGMAFIFGVVIAEPLVLAIFHTAVDQQVKDSRADDLKQHLATWESCNPVQLSIVVKPGCENFVVPPPEGVPAMQVELASKTAQETTLKAQLAPLDKQHSAMVKLSQDECLGKGGNPALTGTRGNGPVCKRLLADAVNFAKLNRIDALKAQVVKLSADRNRLTEQISAASVKWGADRRGFIDAKVAERKANQKDIGLLERIEALNTLAATHASLALGIWTVRALFILVDCAPAIAKFTSGATTYDRLAERRLNVGELQHSMTAQEDSAYAQQWAQDNKDVVAVQRARMSAQRVVERDQIQDDLEQHWARYR